MDNITIIAINKEFIKIVLFSNQYLNLIFNVHFEMPNKKIKVFIKSIL